MINEKPLLITCQICDNNIFPIFKSLEGPCMQDAFARAHSALRLLGQAHATIGYLVYNQICL